MQDDDEDDMIEANEWTKDRRIKLYSPHIHCKCTKVLQGIN